MSYFDTNDVKLLKKYYQTHLDITDSFDHIKHPLILSDPTKPEIKKQCSEIKIIFLILCRFSKKSEINYENSYLQQETELYDVIYENLFNEEIFYNDTSALPDRNIHIPYDFISFFIYNSNRNFTVDDMRTYDDNFGVYLSEFLTVNQSNVKASTDNTKKIIDKIKRQILLATHQKEFMLKASLEAESIAKEAKDTAEESKHTLNTMFSNYVTILGIFATIIFAIFGGQMVLSKVLEGLTDNLNIPVLILFSSIILVSIVLILNILRDVIKNLQDSNYKSDALYYAYIGCTLVIGFCLLWIIFI